MYLPSGTCCILTDIFLLAFKKSELIQIYECCMAIFKSCCHLVLYTMMESQLQLIYPLILDINEPHNSAEVFSSFFIENGNTWFAYLIQHFVIEENS